MISANSGLKRYSPFGPSFQFQLRTLFALAVAVGIYITLIRLCNQPYGVTRFLLHLAVLHLAFRAQAKTPVCDETRKLRWILNGISLLAACWHFYGLFDLGSRAESLSRFDRLQGIAVANVSFTASCFCGLFLIPARMAIGRRPKRIGPVAVCGSVVVILLVAILFVERYFSFLGGLQVMDASCHPVQFWKGPLLANEQIHQRWFGAVALGLFPACLAIWYCFGLHLKAGREGRPTSRIGVILGWGLLVALWVELMWNVELAPPLLRDLFWDSGISFPSTVIALLVTLLPAAVWLGYLRSEENGRTTPARIELGYSGAMLLVIAYLLTDFAQYSAISIGPGAFSFRQFQELLEEYIKNGAIAIYVLPLLVLAVHNQSRREAVEDEQSNETTYQFSMARFGWSAFWLLAGVPICLINVGRATLAATLRWEGTDSWIDEALIRMAAFRFWTLTLAILLALYFFHQTGFPAHVWQSGKKWLSKPITRPAR